MEKQRSKDGVDVFGEVMFEDPGGAAKAKPLPESALGVVMFSGRWPRSRLTADTKDGTSWLHLVSHWTRVLNEQ